MLLNMNSHQVLSYQDECAVLLLFNKLWFHLNASVVITHPSPSQPDKTAKQSKYKKC